MNLFSSEWQGIFTNNYKAKFNNIQKNLVIHHSLSPYNESSIEFKNTSINLMRDKTDKLIGVYNKKLKSIIGEMQAKEKNLAKKLGEYCFDQLQNTNGVNYNEISRYYNNLMQSIDENFNFGMKNLNKLFLMFSKSKMSSVLNEQGYYDTDKFFGRKDIKEIMSTTFEQFIKIFSSQTSGNITKKIYSNSNIEKKFIATMNIFLEEQKKAEAKGNWDIAAAYEGIIQYCTGRGVTLINYIENMNKKISFENTQEKLMSNISNNDLRFLVSKATKHNVYTTIRKKNKQGIAEKESIEGSFYGSITSPNQGGIILEYLNNLLLNQTYTMKVKNGITSMNTGRATNILGKAQKNDIIATFGLSLKDNTNFDFNKKNTNGLEIGTYTIKNPEQIGISIKNYKAGSDIAVHTGGNLLSITNFLKTYNNLSSTKTNDFCKYLERTEVKYFLINEIGEKNSKFLEQLKNSISLQGAILTLTPFLLKTKDGYIDESVDFFLIDQVLIPGSLIIQYANEAVKLGQLAENNRVSAGSGFYTSISGTKPTDEMLEQYIQNYNTKKTNEFPYGKNYLKAMSGLGTDVFNKITFRVEMRESFKKNLQKLISDIGGK